MSQDELRTRLCTFLKSEGTTQKFVANKLGIDEPDLSKFKNKKGKLFSSDIDRLDDFLVEKGY